MAHLHNLNPTLHLLGKKLNAKFKPEPELGSLEDALPVWKSCNKSNARLEHGGLRKVRTSTLRRSERLKSHHHFLRCR